MNASKDVLLKAIADGNLLEFRFTNIECKRSWKQEDGKSISSLGNRIRDSLSFLVVGVEDNGVDQRQLELRPNDN